MRAHLVVAPLVVGALLFASCRQPVSDVLELLNSQERASIAAQTSSPSAGCTAKTLEDAACRPSADWSAAASMACGSQTASRLLFAGACGEGTSMVVAFECCGSTAVDPGLTVCAGGQLFQDGGGSSCKSKAVWTSYAKYDCQAHGLAFGDIRFEDECEPGNYSIMKYTCCPSRDVPLYTLWSGDMGPCNPDLLGDSNGWDCRGCGGIGGCGLSWTFYPPSLPFGERRCKFELYRSGSGPATAVLADQDCAAFKCWMTSDVLLHGLDEARCANGSGDEQTGVELLDGQSHGMKYTGCDEEPFRSHRYIVDSILESYFPASP
jgi:hypothetical protein